MKTLLALVLVLVVVVVLFKTPTAIRTWETAPVVGSSCKTWQPCWTRDNPDECCRTKPEGCDSGCHKGRVLYDPLKKSKQPLCPCVPGAKQNTVCKGGKEYYNACQAECLTGSAQGMYPARRGDPDPDNGARPVLC